MFNSIRKITSKYTGLLIRMDDIAESMNWELMDRCEILFDKYKIKPLLGVIPVNQDPELLKFQKNEKFWEKVNSWKEKGWEITMHGCHHLYTQKSDKKYIFNYGGNSEFYGLDYSLQLNKIKAEHLTRNSVSGRVLKKLGFKKEGTLKQHVKKWGVFEDVAVYGLLKRDHD